MQVTLCRDLSYAIRLMPSVEFVVFIPPRTQGVIVDPNYPVGHPTSAARLAQPPWGPWADGTHPIPPYPIPAPPPPAYYAPYYHPGMPHPLPLASAQFHPHTPDHPYPPPTSSPDNETCVPPGGQDEITASPKCPQELELDHADEPRPDESPVPVIDPSLETSEAYASGKSPVSLAITSAAVQAVLDETRRIEQQQKRTESAATASGSGEPSPNTYAIPESTTMKAITNANSSVSPEASPGEHPRPTMLIEDGETMLHPGE